MAHGTARGAASHDDGPRRGRGRRSVAVAMYKGSTAEIAEGGAALLFDDRVNCRAACCQNVAFAGDAASVNVWDW